MANMVDIHPDDAVQPDLAANELLNEFQRQHEERKEASKALVRLSRHSEGPRDRDRRRGKQRVFNTRPTTAPTRRGPPPVKGSILDIIRRHRNRRVYVDPLFWIPYHLVLLKVRVSTTLTIAQQKQAVRSCALLGHVCLDALACVLQYSYYSERDENLEGLIWEIVMSFQDYLWQPIFVLQEGTILRFRLGGARCSLTLPLLVCEAATGIPVLAFTHESSRGELKYLPSYRRFTDGMKLAMPLPETESGIHPHDAAILIAMAQEASRISASMGSLRDRTVPFTPVLITPTKKRDSLHVFQAMIPQDYLDSLRYTREAFTSGILITRTDLAYDDPDDLLDGIGHVLKIHSRLTSIGLHWGALRQSRRKRKRCEEE